MAWPKGMSRKQYFAERAAKDASNEKGDSSEGQQGEARHGVARMGMAGQDEVWRGAAGQGKVGLGEARRGEARQSAPKWTMKAGNNWETARGPSDNVDRFHIPRDEFPAGYDLQWITETVYGERQTRRINSFFSEGGWTPVHSSDFDGWGSRRNAPTNEDGFISDGGQLLCARPEELSIASRKREETLARQQIALKEQAFRSGELPATGADHPSAKAHNRITRTMERIDIPKD